MYFFILMPGLKGIEFLKVFTFLPGGQFLICALPSAMVYFKRKKAQNNFSDGKQN